MFLLFISLAFSFELKAVEINILESLEAQIKQNNKYVSDERAEKLARLLNNFGLKYGINPFIMSALIRVESSYKTDAINIDSDDYGLCQINKYNIKAYKFDLDRLLKDDEYSMQAGFIVFNYFLKRYKKYGVAVKRYNCGTKLKCVKAKKVKEYLQKVRKYTILEYRNLLD